MRRTKNILPLACLLLASCALLTGCVVHRLQGAVGASYANRCTKTDNHRTIDAYDALTSEIKATFEAIEYIDCSDGGNLVVVTWEGARDEATVNIARQIIAEFFAHFHAEEHIKYNLVPGEDDDSTLIYQFEYYTPHRTIMSF